MIYDKYVSMIRGKLESAGKIYIPLAYRKVGELQDIRYYETKEHLHSAIPQDGYKSADGAFSWGGEWGNAWIRGTARVPDCCKDTLFILCRRPERLKPLFQGRQACRNHQFQRRKHYERIPCGLSSTAGADAGTEFDVALECYAGHFAPAADLMKTTVSIPNPTRHLSAASNRLISAAGTKKFWFLI